MMAAPSDSVTAEAPTPAEELAFALVEADENLLSTLRSIRLDSGLTPADIAERTGWSVSRVKWMEAYWADPRLSDIRRYAIAVGGRYRHEVDPAALG